MIMAAPDPECVLNRNAPPPVCFKRTPALVGAGVIRGWGEGLGGCGHAHPTLARSIGDGEAVPAMRGGGRS